MCKQLCEQTDEGRALWERWRTHRDNWKEVSAFHREAVLAAMREDAAHGAQFQVFMCPRDEQDKGGKP